MPDKPLAQRSVELAAITGAHGVTGEVRLKLFGEGVESLSPHSAFHTNTPHGTLTLRKVRSDNKGGAIARFAEVSDRNAAEGLRGTVLSVPREALPPLEPGEFYHADLIGLRAEDDAGNILGKVVAIENFGATDIIEIEKTPPPAKGMKTFMVPLTEQAVIEWDETRLVIAQDFVDA